jgi:hypothetical protein
LGTLSIVSWLVVALAATLVFFLALPLSLAHGADETFVTDYPVTIVVTDSSAPLTTASTTDGTIPLTLIGLALVLAGAAFLVMSALFRVRSRRALAGYDAGRSDDTNLLATQGSEDAARGTDSGSSFSSLRSLMHLFLAPILVLLVLAFLVPVPAQAAPASPLPVLFVERGSGRTVSTTFNLDTSALTDSRYVRLEAAITQPSSAGIALNLQSHRLSSADATVLDIRSAADIRPSGVYPLTLSARADRATPVGTYKLTMAIETVDKRTDVAVTGITPISRVYDGTDDIFYSGTPSLRGVLTGDKVVFNSLSFALDGKNEGARDIVVEGSLAGTDAFKYLFDPRVVDGSGAKVGVTISPKPVTITGITATKTYDGTATSAVPQFTGGTVNGVVAGETLAVNLAQASGIYFSKDVHAGQPMTGVTDVILVATLPALASNYQIAGPVQASGTITTRPVTITDIIAGKTYDGNTTSDPSQFSSGTVNGAATGEALGVDFTAASGSYASKDSEGGLPMTGVAGITLNATPPALTSNYQLTGQLTATGWIMPRALSFTGTLLVPAKPYDGWTTAPDESSITVVNPTSFSGLLASEGFTLSTQDITSVDAYPSAEGGNYALGYRGAPTLTAPTGGALASNYQLSMPLINGSITIPIQLTVTVTVANQLLYLNKYFENSYRVDWGDDSPLIDKPAGTTLHTYAERGTYTVAMIPYSYSEYSQWTFSSTNALALVARASTASATLRYVPPMHFFMTDAVSAPASFFAYFNSNGAITSINDGAGNFNTSAITTVSDRFFYSFNRNGALVLVPDDCFNTSAITTAGSDFFASFNQSGNLISLPPGSFNTSGVVTAGSRFFYNFNYLGSLDSVPDSFLWPSIASPSGSSNFWYSFNSATSIGGTTAQKMINGCPAPAIKAYTFSSNQPGYGTLASNWQG